MKTPALQPAAHYVIIRILRGIWPWLLLCACVFAQSPLERAVTLAREKRYREANKLLERVAEPAAIQQRIAFHRLKAAIASGLGDNQAAVAEMRLALALAPGEPSLLLATAVAELEAGRQDDALQHAGRAGNLAEAQAVIGDIQEKRGEFAKAVAAYRNAVALAPQQERYRFAFGFELIRHQAFRPAIAVLQKSAPLFPRSGRIRTLLGIAQYADGDSREAMASFQDAIAADPKLEAAYRCLAQIVLQSSIVPPQPAIDSLCSWNQVVCNAMRLRVAHERGNVQLEEASIADLKRAPAENVTAHCELGRAYEWRGRLPQAREELEACVRLDPNPRNHYRLGLVYKKLGLDDLARQQMNLRSQLLGKMSEQTALGLTTLQSLDQPDSR